MLKFDHTKLARDRKELNLNPETMVRELYKHGMNIHRTTWDNWERGDTQPKVDELAMIAWYFENPIQSYFIIEKK